VGYFDLATSGVFWVAIRGRWLQRRMTTMGNLEKLLAPKEIGEILNFKKSKVNRMLAVGRIFLPHFLDK
jgi:hypothetical protein